jgi:peptidoglycan/xylan/chitin deacetylase (PgdA/CDA1 family)
MAAVAQWIRRQAAPLLPPRVRKTLRCHSTPPILALLYHRVSPQPGRDHNRLVVTPENFSGQLAWLKRHAIVWDESELLGCLSGGAAGTFSGRAGRPIVLITFDDGYADNIEHALPVLNAHDCSALLFVATGFVARGEAFWWDMLESAVFDSQRLPPNWALPGGAQLSTARPRADLYDAARRALRRMSQAERRIAIQSLVRASGQTPDMTGYGRPASWAELHTWLDRGGTIGGHGVWHSQMSSMDNTPLRTEIRASRRMLESELGIAARGFSYPFGEREDFNTAAEQMVCEAGYECAFANWEGHVRWQRNRYALPRYIVRNWTPAEFETRFRAWCRR